MKNDFKHLAISNRLMIAEAQKRHWKIEEYKMSDDLHSSILRATKKDKEFFFSSTNIFSNNTCGYFASIDKFLTYNILRNNGISVPNTIEIKENNDGFNEAVELARKKSVVVKPSSLDHGDGISINVKNEKQLNEAVKKARKAIVKKRAYSSSVIAQEQVNGAEYRFFVLDGKCVAVANRRSPRVVGDGQRTISDLIDEKNSDPRRGKEHENILTIIDKDEVACVNGEQFLQRIPQKGEEVEVLPTSNLSRGGEAINVTAIASTDLKKMAIEAASRCQLGVAGVDIITKDIKTGNSANSYVIEINNSPGLRMHMFPSVGESIDVAAKIIRVAEKNAQTIGKKPLIRVGRTAIIKSSLFRNSVVARIDTGAKKSSIWASDIHVDEQSNLCYTLFCEGSDGYTGKIETTKDFSVAVVRNSTGQDQIRYIVKIPIAIKGKKIRATFTLSDRSNNSYPILIGRSLLKNKFLVEPSRRDKKEDESIKEKNILEENLKKELKKDARQFHKKYAKIIIGAKK